MKLSFFNRLSEDSKFRRRFTAGVLSLFMLIFLVFSDHGILKRIKLEVDNHSLQESINEQKRVNDSLGNRIRALQEDTLEIEKIAREKYGMVKPGETVILVPVSKQNVEE